MGLPAAQEVEFEMRLLHLDLERCQALQLAAAEVLASHLDAVGNFRNHPDDLTFQILRAAAGFRRMQVDPHAAVEMLVESYQTAAAAEE